MIRQAIAFLLILGLPLFAVEDLDKAKKMISSGHYKEAIKLLQSHHEGDYLKLLAESYYKDQEHAKAFEVFIKALNTLPKDSKYQAGKEEALYYQEGLRIYLDPNDRDPKGMSLKIRDLYAGVWHLHPEYAELGYLVAIAQANLGDYVSFFNGFYDSYKKAPDHFLSYKTQGILHIKLYERAKTPEEKEEERKSVLYYLKKAKERYPADASLYKMEITFSQDKDQVIEVNLKEIIDKDIVVPRSDLSFYIDQMLAYGKDDLAVEFIEKARKWYSYSRTLDSAKELLKEKQMQRGNDGARGSR